MSTGLKALALVLLASSTSVWALTPPPEPHNHTVYSASRHFRADISVRTKSTAVKEVRKGRIDPVRWRIPHYFEWLAISDNGEFVMTYTNLVTPPFSKEERVIWVYHRDGTETSIKLGSVVRNLSRLEPAMGLGDWGSVQIASGPWLKVQTCEGRALYVHVKSCEVRASIPSDAQHPTQR